MRIFLFAIGGLLCGVIKPLSLQFASMLACCMLEMFLSILGRNLNGFRYSHAFIIALLMPVSMSALGKFEPERDPMRQRALQNTQTDKELVERAISINNVLLSGKEVRIVLSLGKSITLEVFPNAEKIPVYLVQSPPTASATPAAVPKGCRCIFVNPSVFNAFVKDASTGTGRLTLNATYLMVFILLHEVGHLMKSTSGAEFANGELSELNIDPSLAKANEEHADEFAADLVRTLMQRKPASVVSVEATTVAMELGSLVWNMQAHRSLDEFGASWVGKPSVFFDKNLTHPNLDWRVLRMNYLIHPSPESKALLDTFEDARRRGANPEPLYVAPKK